MSKRVYKYLCVVILAIIAATALAIQGRQQQQSSGDPMTQKQMEEMNKRGDKVMGFDHMKTTHHFLLKPDGGIIQVEANDSTDKESRDEIRKHLSHIAKMFSEGNFGAPMLVHTRNPPGADAMKRLKANIEYQFSETERGAAIRIITADPEALGAIHEFLTFQIKEHKTGDPLEISN